MNNELSNNFETGTGNNLNSKNPNNIGTNNFKQQPNVASQQPSISPQASIPPQQYSAEINNLNQEINIPPQQPDIPPQDNLFDDKQIKKLNNKGGGKIALAIVIILVLVAGGIFAYYNFILMNEERIVKKGVNNIFKLVESNIDSLDKSTLEYDLEKDAIGIEGKVSIDLSGEIEGIDLSKLNDYNLSYSGVIDVSNNKLSGNIILNNNANKLLSLYTYLNGKVLLLKSEDLYSSPVRTDIGMSVQDLETTKSLNYKDIKTLVKATKTITVKYIDKQEITKKTVKKEINGKTSSYTKISCKIDMNDYSIEMLKEYINNDEVLEILSNLSNTSKEELKENFKEEIEYLEDAQKEYFNIETYLDTLTGAFKCAEISKEVEGEVLTIIKEKEIYNFNMKEDEETRFTGSYNPKKESFNIEVVSYSTSLKATITKENNTKYSVVININSDGVELNVKADINREITSNSEKTDIVIEATAKNETEEIFAKITNNNTMTKDAKVEEIDGNSAKDAEDLTEEDIEAIQNKLNEIFEPLISEFVQAEDSDIF